MTHFVADETPQSRMRVARNAAELVLFGIREITARFDREGVARSIREGIAFIYRAMDAGPDSLVQPEALSQGATSLGAARERLLNTVAKRTFQVDRAAAILADAQAHLQAACEVVAFDQLARRMELPWGNAEEVAHTEPFRTSHGTPQLFALRREPIAPALDLGEAEPAPE
ncbi:MAG TPA: hypothetical protein VKP30_14435, partial [Polyangiaceae bacterium]|nr:hypothetical protein [Polyangiaceae bacterium]